MQSRTAWPAERCRDSGMHAQPCRQRLVQSAHTKACPLPVCRTRRSTCTRQASSMATNATNVYCPPPPSRRAGRPAQVRLAQGLFPLRRRALRAAPVGAGGRGVRQGCVAWAVQMRGWCRCWGGGCTGGSRRQRRTARVRRAGGWVAWVGGWRPGGRRRGPGDAAAGEEAVKGGRAGTSSDYPAPLQPRSLLP